MQAFVMTLTDLFHFNITGDGGDQTKNLSSTGLALESACSVVQSQRRLTRAMTLDARACHLQSVVSEPI
jgi:hypothetical protein